MASAHLYVKSYNPAELIEGWGSPFKICQTSFKLYPSTRPVHGAIASVLELRERFNLKAGELEQLVIRTFDMAVKLCDRPSVNDVHQAIFSAQYNAAVALLYGNVTIDHFKLEAVQSDDVQKILRKIEICPKEDLTREYPTKWIYEVEAQLLNGSRIESIITAVPGSPGAPLAHSVIREKARSLIAPRIGHERAEVIIATIEDLENVDDVPSIIPALTVPIKLGDS